MTLTSKLLKTISIVLLVQLSYQDCLANQTLSDLGLGSLNKTNFTNATYCKNAFNQYGGCISAENMATFLNSANTILKNRIDDGSSFGNVFDNLKGNVQNLLGTTKNTTFDDATIQTIKDKSLSSRNACLKSLALINQGAYCLLASQGATNFATDFGTYVEVRANMTEAGVALEDCLPLIDATCTVFFGNPISNTAIYNITNNVTINVLNSTCNDLKAGYNCTSDVCMATRRTILINQLFNGNDIKFVPSKTTLDSIAETFKNLWSKFTNIFKRRLLATTKVVTLTATSTNGKNLVADGQASGLDYPQIKSAKIAFAALVSALFALFL